MTWYHESLRREHTQNILYYKSYLYFLKSDWSSQKNIYTYLSISMYQNHFAVYQTKNKHNIVNQLYFN